MSYLSSYSNLPTGAESITLQHGMTKAFLGRARVNMVIAFIDTCIDIKLDILCSGECYFK